MRTSESSVSAERVEKFSDVESGAADQELGVLDLLTVLAGRWKLLAATPVVVGLLAFGAAWLMPPIYTARTVFVPPQQQSSAASALASLGALAGLAGGGPIKTPGDQYVALLQSVNVEDRLVDQFKLMDLYEAEYRFIARRQLEKHTRIELGKKDGLISIEVDAKDAKLAADMANQYVAELRRLSGELALTEAQQRRAFYEVELKRTRERLTEAQRQLEAGGFSPNAMKAEPKTAAENFARIKAELTSAEVRLQTLRQSRADNSPEILQQVAMVSALRGQLAQLEVSSTNDRTDADYLGRYREFKYQESLFDLISKQYELARVDESRDGTAIQVVDVAVPPEYKSKPKRLTIALGAAFAALLLMTIGVLARHFWREARQDPEHARKMQALRDAWKGRTA